MDRVTAAVRSRNMSKVRSHDTRPELAVRKALHAHGFRFRLQRRDLPGRPDLVLPAYRIAVLVHGCFWHGHDCARGRRPATNTAFWNAKLDANMDRDRRSTAALKNLGWAVRIVWECELASGTADLVAELKTLRAQASAESTR